MCPGVIVLICVSLSRTAMQLSPINSYPGYILNSISLVKGIRIQEGSPYSAFYTLGILSWVTFGAAVFPWGTQPPFLSAVPFSGLKAHLPLFLPAVGNPWWSGLGYQW